MIMNATISNSRWTGFLDVPQRMASGELSEFARLGVEPRAAHCPSCHSIVYTRRHPQCGACGESLPDECLFTHSEARNVETMMQSERQRHRAWIERASTSLSAWID